MVQERDHSKWSKWRKTRPYKVAKEKRLFRMAQEWRRDIDHSKWRKNKIIQNGAGCRPF